ncbi:MAG: SRPBCC domain-containing protein [Actinomycetota bacterium]|nr:SRPBCC domain-containing protein [Actinomycetota bacterium]
MATEHHQTDTRITVARTIDAPASAIFDVLTLPARHKELDGSGFIVSDEHADRITHTGQVFTMNMQGDHMGGEYQTDNHVVGYDKNALVAWKPAPAGTEPPGWEWVWQLAPQGPDATNVTLVYDWGQVTDKDLLQKVHFPLVSEQQLEDSLSHLASAVSGS